PSYSVANCARGIVFFQAEDGIRAFHVTGVQTCALPIYRLGGPRPDLPPAASPAYSPRGRPPSVAHKRPTAHLGDGPDGTRKRNRDRKSVEQGKSGDRGGGRIATEERNMP